MFRYIGRVIVNTALFFVIFATLSITGVLVEDMQWKWAVEKWAYVSEGGLRADQLRKKMDGAKFPKGSYETYINPHTNGNLAASDQVSACVFKDRFYLALPDSLFMIKRDHKKDKEKREEISCSVSHSALIGGKRYVLAVDEEAFRITQMSKKFTCDLEENPAWEFDSLDFSGKSDLLYEILRKQDKKKITSRELALLAYGTKQGILLDYQDGTAYFADDSSGDMVYVYKRTGKDEDELIFQYENSYEGLGAGRFIMEHYFVGVENFELKIYDLDTGEVFYTPEGEHVDGAVNYTYSLDGDLYLCYVCEGVLYCRNFSDREVPVMRVNMHTSDEGGTMTGLFCYGRRVYLTHEGGESRWHAYDLEKE